MLRPFKFIFAYLKWWWYGKEKRSPYQIRSIYHYVCKPCDKFKPSNKLGEGTCGICGCYLKEEGDLNKIAWKTEKCPASPPKWQ